jgi:hypothetical protein
MADFLQHFGSGDSTPGTHWMPGMIGAIAFGTLVYHVLGFWLLKGFLQKVYSRFSWWDYLATYPGLICKDTQKEILYISILAIHHIFGGGLMAYGSVTGSTTTFIAGTLVSLMDDVHDTLCMLLPAWPFGGAGEKRDVKLCTFLLIHHSAAMLITFPAICMGLATNLHVQRIGSALLLAGGFSHATITVSRTRDRRNPVQASHDACIWLVGTGCFLFCRFVVFPTEVLAIYREDYVGWATEMRGAFTLFVAFMSVFNLAIGVDAIQGTAKRVALALKTIESPKVE